MKSFVLFFLLWLPTFVGAQNPNYSLESRFWGNMVVGKFSLNPFDPSAILELGVVGTDRGFLPPRTDTAKLLKTAEGLLIYSTTQKQLMIFSDGHWQPVCSHTYAPPSSMVAYWGEKTDATVLSEAAIKASTAHEYTAGQNITAQYTNPTESPKYLWVAYPATEAGITKYYLNALDTGPLGNNGSFALPVAVGSLLYIQSTIPTSTAGQPVIFQH